MDRLVNLTSTIELVDHIYDGRRIAAVYYTSVNGNAVTPSPRFFGNCCTTVAVDSRATVGEILTDV